jgi:hypothetical protein
METLITVFGDGADRGDGDLITTVHFSHISRLSDLALASHSFIRSLSKQKGKGLTIFW